MPFARQRSSTARPSNAIGFVLDRWAVARPSLAICYLVFCCLVSGLSAPSASAQEPATASAQDPIAAGFIEVMDLRVVNVDVFVTDRSGDPVESLSQEDFELIVDGKPMPISNFYSETRGRARELVQPLERRSDTTFTSLEEIQSSTDRRAHVVLMIDHTRLGPTKRKRAFTALREAISELDDEDLIAVVGVEGSLVFYSDFLYDRKAVGEILDEIDDISMDVNLGAIERRQIYGLLARGQSGGFLGRVTDVNEGQVLTRIQTYAAEEYARSLRSLAQIDAVISTLAGVPGRKALLYLGEGIPTRPGEGMWVEYRNRFGGGSDAELGIRRVDFNTDYTRAVGNYDLTTAVDKVARSANQAGLTFYAIDADPDHGNELRSALTEQGSTSESVSVVDENYRAPLEAATKATGGRLLRASGRMAEHIGDVMQDFDSFYSLGFEAPADWQANSEHDIQVKVKGRGRLVRHRDRMRVPKPGEREASATVAALMYETLDNPLGIAAKPGSEAPREDGTAALPVLLEIPVGKLTLVPKSGTHAASVTIFVSIKDRDGNPGPVQRIPFHLDIPDDKVEEAKGRSAHYTLPLVLRAGDRQVAIGVRDDVAGTLSTIRIEVAQFSQAL